MRSIYLVLTVFLLCFAVGLRADERAIDPSYDTAKMLIQKGKLEEGILQLQQLATQYPDQPLYAATLKIQQDLRILNLIKVAETQRLNSQLSEANASFNEALKWSPNNVRALDGLKRITHAQNHNLMLINAQTALKNNDIETAQLISRSILAEDANHIEARQLFEMIEKSRIEKTTTIPKLQTAFKQPITLEFKNTPIKSIFEFIGKATKLNFTYDRELNDNQQTSIFLRDTPLEDAIEVILSSNQLAKKVLNQNTLLIYPLSRSAEYQELFVRSFYLSNLDAKRALNMIKTVVKSKDVYIDEKLNTLIMRDTLSAIQMAEKLIASQDMTEPEVMLEVEVMEVNRKNLEAIGVTYPTQIGVGVQGRASSSGVTTLTPGRLSLAELKNFNSGLGVFTISDPALALSLLQQNTDTNLLANPQIRVKNREKAKIHVGDKIPVLTSVANSTGFVSQTVSYLDVGIKLDVEPTILLQNQVSIKVGLEVSNVTDQVKTDSGVLAYTIGSRNANTTLQLKDGETQILAGLFRDDSQSISNGVPGLSRLPFIGRLFTNKNNDRRKNEIVLLITPRIINNITPANHIYTVFPSGVEHSTSKVKQVENNAPAAAPIQAISLPTPQNLQAEKSAVDRDFASQLLQPALDANASNHALQ